jgi:deoxyribodipyrimidine photo-lyase
MLVLHGSAKKLIPEVSKLLSIENIYVDEDYEPGAIARDEVVKAQAPLRLFKDHLLTAPYEVAKDDGSPYRVYTPYSKACRAAFIEHSFEEKKVTLTQGNTADISHIHAILSEHNIAWINADKGADHILEMIGYSPETDDLWKPEDTLTRLTNFIDHKLNAYKEKRDLPGIDGTSQISPYLRFGLVSIRECARATLGNDSKGAFSWMNELIWRDFYAMILYHYPETTELEFIEALRGKIQWRDDEEMFTRWCEGRTGYPIIDAAMRQLKQDGWMHNRTRMIVASFLTKDLQIDWRKGEEHFAQYLMDYDMASNVGGWQWAASTGTDAQPWFRIFNPILQSKKFDPEGVYIRKYVPELKYVSNNAIHEPCKYKKPMDYPAPIIDHFEARDITMAMYKQALGKED